MQWLAATAVLMAASDVRSAPVTTRPAAQTVESACPGLASGALAQARLVELPDGTLVRAGELTITVADVKKELKDVPEEFRAPLERETFYVAERMATRRLLLVEAKAARGKEAAATSDAQLIDALLRPVAEKVKIDEAEVKAFYERNAQMFGGAALKDVKPHVEAFLREEKEQEAVRAYIRGLGQRLPIEVSRTWAAEQLKVTRQNPVDEARWSGKRPTLAAFGTAGCACSPDLTGPLMAALAERLKGKAAVVYVDARQDFILAERYGVESVPTFVVFDAQGREVVRRSGAMSEDDLIALIPGAK